MSPSDPVMSDPRWMFYCVMNASEQELLDKHRASEAVKWRIEGRLRIPTVWAQACRLVGRNLAVDCVSPFLLATVLVDMSHGPGIAN